MKKPFVLMLMFALWAGFLPAFGQTQAYRFKHLDVDQGLTHNEVTCFYKDSRGFLWIGTTSGLNRFDGYAIRTFVNDSRDALSLNNNYIQHITALPDGKIGVITPDGLTVYDPNVENFSPPLNSYLDSIGIQTPTVNNVAVDRQQNFWFLHNTTGITRLSKGIVHAIRHRAGDKTSIASDTVSGFSQDDAGNRWIIHSNGVFEKIDDAGLVLYRNDFLFKKNNHAHLDYDLFADKEGNLWMFAANGTEGVYFFDAKTNTFRHANQESPDLKLNTNIVRSVTEDNTGQIWIATDHGGINVYNKKTGKISPILHREEDEKSLGQNSINTLYKDNDGIIWAGSFKKGVSYYHENLIRFPLYKSYPSDPESLPFGDVNRFVEDDQGNLWIGTNGGGLIYFDRKNDTFRQYKHNPKDPNSISNNVIVSLTIDRNKKLWIGTYYGGLNCFDGKKFRRYINRSNDPESLPDNNVWEIFEDSRNRLWIGTLSQGLILFDQKTESFTQYKAGDLNSVQDNYISAIQEDKEGNLWIGTAKGLDVLTRQTGRFIHYAAMPNDSTSLSDNVIIDIKEDSHERIWIATKGGLNIFDKTKKQFRSLTVDDGLPSNTILTVLEDNFGNFWVSTPNGISHLILLKFTDTEFKFSIANYDEADGLQGKQFNENAAYKTSRGELIFGGANGFNLFKPDQLGMNKRPPTVVISDFQLFQKSLKAGEKIDGEVFLVNAIAESKHITLPYNKNFFTFEVAALNFFHPEKNQYRYMLDGLNNRWLSADSKSRKITFTNLDPGNYTFKVKAANNDGVWNDRAMELKITILPPFWKTNTAFLIYAMLVTGALIATRKLIQQRERMKFAIRQERQEAIRMHELDMMKIKFFTNVSHEFRTPLTLILTPIDKILRQTTDADQQNQFRLIQRNAKRLLNLVNQLLDFRKMEVQEIRFNPSEGDIIQFIRETANSFSDLSEKKNIGFHFNTTIESLETLFDQDKLEKILFNLLSNAFKFTREHGTVSVRLTMTEKDQEKWLSIEVQDTGIGIPPDKLDKIFDRFFQNELPKSIVNQGSGIGLSITKEFVRSHGGTITVESEVDRGSTFSVLIPIAEVFEHAPASSPEDTLITTTVEPQAREFSDSDKAKPAILLVEDNEDFRFYLKDNLKFEFRIIEARHGLDGWQQAIQHLPDLIVSDVMMPEMNGMDLCRKIKEDQRVSHIPVILLTARTAEEQKLEGLQTGADDYITKPFNFEILISRIRNLIAQREKMHKFLPSLHKIKASELNITSLDAKFIESATQCVEQNVANADFSVEDLSRQLGISRANFYKKVMSLTGKSPLEFIRTIRLQHAAQLLEKSQLTVSEIAYSVGFNNPKYFARYFKEAYNELPSTYALRKRKLT